MCSELGIQKANCSHGKKLKPKPTFSRLDRILVNVGSATSIESTEILYNVFSDHCAACIRIRDNKFFRGSGVWKFNSTHLSELDFPDLMRNTISYSLCNGVTLPIDERWEILKENMIECCKTFAKQCKKKRISNKLDFTRTLSILHHDLVVDCTNEDIQSVIMHIENELKDLELQKISRAVFRSRSNFALLGERNTSYFLSLEKRNYLNKDMKAMETKDGIIVKEQEKILLEQKRFYQELYTSNKMVVFDLQPRDDEMILLEEHRKLLSVPITLDEIKNSVQMLAKNKVPGLDGLNKEFYEYFFVELGPVLLELYNYCYAQGKLNKSARQGLISLLPKKDRNILKLNAWRPLTLLNLDYKILSKMMAE